MRRPRHRRGADVLVLCYHAVSETWESPLAVTPDALRRQVRSLRERGYVPRTFTETVRRRPGGRTVVITFDDAYRSVFALARPVLAQLGAPATVFAPTDFIGTGAPMAWPGIEEWIGGPHESELVAMDWSELGSLADAGWEVGSHTRSHAVLPELSRAELHAELEGSRAVCEAHLLRPCESVAYPFGRTSPEVIAAARRAGYAAGGALRPRRWYGDDPLSRPRLGIMRGEGDARFRRQTSRPMRRLTSSPAWPVADPVARWAVAQLRRAGLRR